jgi:translation initiation factor IF-2
MPKNPFGFIYFKQQFVMPDKSIVDDYYSSVSPQSSDKTGWEDKKLKIKPKKLAVKIKKAAPVAEIKPSVSSEISEPVQEKTVQPSTAPLPEKVASIRVAPQTQWVVAKVEKKPENTPYKKMTVTRRATDEERRNIQNVQRGGSANRSSSAPRRSSAPQRAPAPKVFHDNKPSGWGRNEFSKQKKSTLTPYRGKQSRGKVKSIDDDGGFKRSNKIIKKKKEEKNIEDIKQNLVNRTWQTVVVSDGLVLKELSDKIGVPLSSMIAEFMKNGLMLNINSPVDFESASIVAEAFDIVLQRDNSAGMAVEEVLEWNLDKLLAEDDNTKLQNRPPVISIMGHVDHGKTSLLDHIRKSKVVDGEAGWITQSIGAYQVEVGDQKITFLDTPGHEAFTVMRARWAKSTDIAILVVAANEWVKPQTIESINHAKEAGIPVIVAINKMDLEWANPDHVKGQLAEHGLTPEDWGGETPMVPVSAQTGFGIDDLLEIIVLVAEMRELKANPNRSAVATVIESHLDANLWPVATILINGGTLNKWDDIVCKDALGKIKVMKNHLWVWVTQAFPGDPVLIVGLGKVIQWW